MKGIILAGGNGTRLRPLTNITNKHLIGVYNKPMIDYPLNTLISMGIKDILIVSGREHAGHFIEYLGSGSDRGVNLTYKVQERAGGIAEALGIAESFADFERVAVILGDNFFSHQVLPPEDETRCGLVLKKVHDPERFGVYDSKTLTIEEKPTKPKSNLAITGLYFYPPDVFSIIKGLKPSQRGELEISDVNNYYLKQRRISTLEFDGFWSDMGTPASLAHTIKYLMSEHE